MTKAVERAVVAATALVSIVGLACEIGHWLAGLDRRAMELFSLSFEANVPTWYASSLLLLCAVALFDNATNDPSERAPFAALAAIFAYMSLDEAIEIHEYLAYLVEGEGIFYFAWVIPAAIVVIVLGALFVPFLRRLPAASRRAFVIAGCLYVGGALLMELPLGAWTEAHGADNLVYGTIDWVEESLELAGATLFLIALHRHRRSLPEAPA